MIVDRRYLEMVLSNFPGGYEVRERGDGERTRSYRTFRASSS